jgi:hypothetical protein
MLGKVFWFALWLFARAVYFGELLLELTMGWRVPYAIRLSGATAPLKPGVRR